MGKSNKTPATSSGAPALDVRIQTSGPIEAPSFANQFTFTDAVSKFIRPVSLSEAGKKYIDTLTEKFSALPPSSGFRIKVETIPSTVEIRAVIDEVTHRYIVLYFNESYSGNAMEPVVNMNPDVVRTMQGINADVKMLQTIVVMPEDYTRVEKMFAHILNCFMANKVGDAIDANIFQQMRLSPNTDLRAVKDFIDKRSPHETQDRIEWGVLLTREIRQNTTGGYTADRQIINEPVMAIAGYTRFIRRSSYTGDRVFPVCVITNITSDIPSQNILPVAIPTAAANAIVHELWKRPFSTISKDKPNLGRLIRDIQKNELKFFNTLAEMQEEIARSFYFPQLAIDIPEGRAHIVGLENYYYDKTLFDNNARIFFGKTKMLNTLTGKEEMVDVWQGGGNTVTCSYINYEGSVIFEGKTQDTRVVDYLNLVSQLKQSNLQIEQFLLQYPQTDNRLKNIAAILGTDTIYPTYRSHTIVFDSQYVNHLAACLSNVVNYTGEISVNAEMNLASIFDGQGVNAQIAGNNTIYGSYAQMAQPQCLY